MLRRCSLCVVALALLLGGQTLLAQGPAPKDYAAVLSELNGSGISGSASLTLAGNQLTVRLTASGLSPNTRYGQYIRGFVSGAYSPNAVCPPTSADVDGDGTISYVEGLPYFGLVVKSLFVTTGEFPLTDSDGVLTYEHTFTLLDPRTVSPLQSCTIVLQDVNPTFETGLPVACGEIVVAAPGREKR